MLSYRPLDFHNANEITKVVNLELREHDRKEALLLLQYESTQEAILDTLRTAVEAHVIIHDGNIEGAFGVSEGPCCFHPWFFVTDKFDDFSKVTFARVSKQIVEGWRTKYSQMWNISSAHPKMARWLEWLGFEIEKHYNPVFGFYYHFYL